jgi:TolA-binding protein
MTSTDLHPDDLLDREMRDELSPGERERLESHLRECAMCRLERVARDDFQREAEDPAAEGDAHRLVASLLLPAAIQSALHKPARSGMRHVRVVLIAAAVVSVAGWAAARLSGPRLASGGSAPEAPADAPSGVPDRAVHVARLVPAPPAASPAALTISTSPASPVDPPAAVVDRTAAVGFTGSRPRGAAAMAPSRLPAPDPTPLTEARPAPDAAGLFGRATEARRLGDHSGAIHFFRALIEGFPGSAEAQEGLAVLGRMLLDDADADGALQCFDDYLRRGGASREDVMLGRALSLRRLGRQSEEARAWKDLVADYPSSVHAERARRRLLDLEPR